MKILVLQEKGFNRYFIFGKTEESEAGELQAIALTIFKEREEEGWYDREDMTKLQYRYYDMALKGDQKAALTFLSLRDDQHCEYEGFDVVTPEDI